MGMLLHRLSANMAALGSGSVCQPRPHPAPVECRDPAFSGRGTAPSRRTHRRQKLHLVADVIRFVIRFRRQYHAHCARTEVVQIPPHHWAHVDPVIGPVQVEPFAFKPIIQQQIKTARRADNELVQRLVRMFPAIRTAGYIVEVINPPNVKRDVVASFDIGQVSRGSVILGNSMMRQSFRGTGPTTRLWFGIGISISNRCRRGWRVAGKRGKIWP